MANRRTVMADCDTGVIEAQALQAIVTAVGQGPAGQQGVPGIQGIQGPKGDKGDAGTQGMQGIQGLQGPAGTNGTNGTNGSPLSVAAAWPVGSVFLSVVSTNPATLLGIGTWTQIAGSKMLIGQGNAPFDVAEATGGSSTATPVGSNSAPTFTGAALATHQHELPFSKANTATGALSMLAPTTFGTGTSRAVQSISAAPTSNSSSVAMELTEAKSAGTPAGTVSAPVFTGQAGSVLNPYLVVYVWKRTA